MDVKIITSLPATCDQGRALHYLLDLLLEADKDDHVLDESDEEYAIRLNAETQLFVIANEWARRKKNNV